MSLSFKQRIMGSVVLSALVPLVVIGGLATWLGVRNSESIASNGLRVAVDGSSMILESFFKRVENQAHEHAVNPLVVQALKDFTAAEAAFDPATVAVDRAKLRARYELQQQKTPDTTPDQIDDWMPKDAKAEALQYLYIADNANPVGEKQKLDAAGDGSEYSRVHAKYHPFFREFIDTFKYYDYFLIDADSGRVVYTNFKEIDFQTNVKEGPLVNTNFSHTVKKALASTDPKAVFISDIERYMPSYNDGAIFVTAPIVDNGKTIGAVAFQLPTDQLANAFTIVKQLGTTADGFVVGADMKMRTPQQAEDGKFGDPIPDSLVPEVKQVLADGKEHNMQYNGSDGLPMIGAVRKLDINGLEWVSISGQDKAELLASAYETAYLTMAIIVASMVLLSVFGFWLSGMLVKPVMSLSRHFASSAEKVARSTSQVGEAVSGMIAASEETSTQSTVIRKNSSEAAGYVNTVTSAVDELNVSINDISRSIGETNVLIDDAVGKAQRTDEVVRSLGAASKRITEVVGLINDLAEQTNLLALNAAIEAARAGDAGRGFAVVADEVKKLASNTSSATVEIREQVKGIQDVSEQSVVALQAVVEAIHRIRDNATTVSAAVEQQSGVAKQIAGNVRDAAHRVQMVDDNMTGIEQAANDTGVAADQVSGAAGDVQSAFGEMKTQVQGVLDEMGIKA